MFTSEIRCGDLGHQTAVGEAAVALLVAHAVDYYATFLGGALDHFATGAHAKRVHRAVQPEITYQLVIRGRKARVPFRWAVLILVDEVLGVLHANAHGEGFLPHGDCVAVQHLKGVPGTVTRRQNDGIAGYFFAILKHRGFDFPVFEMDVRELGFPAISNAAGFGILADEHRTFTDDIRTHMRLGEIEDAGVRTIFDEGLQNITRGGMTDARSELAIAEGARAAFTKLGIGLWVQLAVLPQLVDALHPLAHGGAALQDDGLDAVVQQAQRAESTRRSTTHDDHAGLARRRRDHVGGKRRRDFQFQTRQKFHTGKITLSFKTQYHQKADGSLVPRIQAAAFQHDIRIIERLSAQGVAQGPCQIQLLLAKVQGQIRKEVAHGCSGEGIPKGIKAGISVTQRLWALDFGLSSKSYLFLFFA